MFCKIKEYVWIVVGYIFGFFIGIPIVMINLIKNLDEFLVDSERMTQEELISKYCNEPVNRTLDKIFV